MRIGIDGSRAFGEEKTGTENYSYEMIRHILALPEAKKHEWIIYTKTGVILNEMKNLCGSFAPLRMTIQPINMPRLWTQIGLAYRTWVDKLDVLWVPAHTLPVLRRPGMRTIVTVHGIEYEWLPAYENWLQRWYLPLSTLYAVQTSSKVIAVSQFTKQQLVERLGAKKEKIEVVYEGTSHSNLPPSLGGRRQRVVLKKFGLKPKQYVLFVGTIQPRKNLTRLVQAFAHVVGRDSSTTLRSARNDNLYLVICGKWGWGYEEVKAAPKKYGIEERVIFAGYVSDAKKNTLMKNALVYVQPSITEGFGLPVIDAMESGVPVVSSNGGALPEILNSKPACAGKFEDPKETVGVLFDPTDVEDMSHRLSLVIDGKRLRKELIAKGKKRAGEFRWEKAADEVLNILENLQSDKENNWG